MIPMRDYLRRYAALAAERSDLEKALSLVINDELTYAESVLRERLNRVVQEMEQMERIMIVTNEPVYDRT